MNDISWSHDKRRIGYDENPRLFRVFKSTATPVVVLVPESQAERILSDDTDLLKPENVFAALLSVPEPYILKSVVLLDEKDEYARCEAHPTWAPAHKSFSGGGQVCFHGVSKCDDPVAILNYHWAVQYIRVWNTNLRSDYGLATIIESGHIWRSAQLDVDWAADMAGDILANRNEIFESFAARAPLRTLVLCRGLGAAVNFDGATPLAAWLKRRVDFAETIVRERARRQLIEIANTSAKSWRCDDAVSLLLQCGEEEDFRSLVGITKLRVRGIVQPPRNWALRPKMDSLEEIDLSFQQNNLWAWLWALSRCPNVKTLTLSGSQTSSSDLIALRSFNYLTDLDLAKTRIFDVALPYLIAKQGLKRLDIRGTEISEEGIAQLRRELPFCEIVTGS